MPLAGVCAVWSVPVYAQLAARVSLDSDYRYRGYSLSGDNPALSGTVSYDHSSGLYATGLVVLTPDESRTLAGFQANIGYAAEVAPQVSAEAGVLRTQYAGASGGPLTLRYTEIYAGLARRGVAARVYYSPDYFRAGRRSLYAEIEGTAKPAPGWSISLHLGGLTYLSAAPRYSAASRYDWRAMLSRTLGPVELRASLSGRGPGGDYYVRSRGRAVATVGASFAF